MPPIFSQIPPIQIAQLVLHQESSCVSLLLLRHASAEHRYFSPIFSSTMQTFMFLSHLAYELRYSVCQDGWCVNLCIRVVEKVATAGVTGEREMRDDTALALEGASRQGRQEHQDEDRSSTIKLGTLIALRTSCSGSIKS
jgi:hypothetical protein